MGEVENCLFNCCDEGRAEVSSYPLRVKPLRVPAYENHLSVPVRQVQDRTLLRGRDDGNRERSRQGTMQARCAQPHECNCVSSVICGGNPVRRRLQTGTPPLAASRRRDNRVVSGRQFVQNAAVGEPAKLWAGVGIDAMSVGRPQHTGGGTRQGGR